jgi:mycothiol synthase
MDRLFSIRPFRGSDEAALIELWNTCLTRDPLTPAIFRTRVLLDANFSAEGLLVAEVDENLVGFVLSLTRQVPFYLQGLEPELGWITAFGVHPDFRMKGIGKQLFDRSIQRARELGRRQVWISPYTPNYFIPGVDINAYEAALGFLKALGWQITSTPIAMQANLSGLQTTTEITRLEKILAEGGITVRPVEASDLPELMPFISVHFGWDWFRFAQEYLLQLFGPGADDIVFLVARSHGTIVGYCQQRRERFGPFGVLPEMRGKGIGSLLLARCLGSMVARGFRCAWFLWTGKHNQRIYSQAGFQPAREFAVMKYEIPG